MLTSRRVGLVLTFGLRRRHFKELTEDTRVEHDMPNSFSAPRIGDVH